MNNMGGLLRDQGELKEAEVLGEEAVRRAKKTMPKGHWITAAFLSEHARTLAAMERFAEAEAEMLEAHEMLVAALGAEHGRTVRLSESLADLYDAWHAIERPKATMPRLLSGERRCRRRRNRRCRPKVQAARHPDK